MEHNGQCVYNAYLLHVLQKRNAELRTAYQHIVQYDCPAHSGKADFSVQTHVETGEVATETLQSFASYCGECCVLRETVENVKQQLNSSIQTVADRDGELVELRRQLVDSAGTILELRARADGEEAARKVKEDQVEELEELVMVCKSESLISEQQQHTVAENSARENELLRSELVAVKARLETKEEALAQTVLEKDDLEDVNDHLQTTITSLQHQLDELQLQLRNQSSQFETKIRRLEDERQELTTKVQNLSAELAECQQSASASFGCSQPGDLLASQQSCGELSAVKLELLTVQAEKEDLIQQLHQCRSELSALPSNLPSRTNPSVQHDSKNDAAPVPVKPPTTCSSGEELERQNAALLGQLLILEDQLSESEALLQESREDQRQSSEQRGTTLKELADVSARVVGLEHEKAGLETELDAARTSLETSEAQLQECRTQLTLVEGKLSSAGNRQRQLMCQKQQLESQNHELLQKLQLTTAASTHHVGSLPSHSTSGHSSNHTINQVKENHLPLVTSLPLTGTPFQQTGHRQLVHNAGNTSECLAHLIKIN